MSAHLEQTPPTRQEVLTVLRRLLQAAQPPYGLIVLDEDIPPERIVPALEAAITCFDMATSEEDDREDSCLTKKHRTL